ncbi:MAG: sugar phosphate isomerase/epimerase [Rikenellaceae bacterium]|jgi:sugar phosphate isomerase/epimerase|nr:sugar phosphate isomerase/epimerase [Rikenellaceae bacterium]
MDRREFLKKSVLSAAGAIASASVLSAFLANEASAKGKVKKRIGLQLYSLREAMKEDAHATLKAIADTGYNELETAGYNNGLLYGMAPAGFRKLCKSMKMNVSGAHIGAQVDPRDMTVALAWWDKALDDQKAAGCRYAIQPSFKIGDSLDDIKLQCEYFNRVGELATKKGIKFGFHNHAKEFEKRGGEVIYDYLINNTDPKHVFYEMDVYWVKKGGADPVEYLKKYAGRFPVLHIKDESIIGESGTLDFQSIFEAAYAQGMKDYYVEVEKYTLPPMNCVEKSYDFLYAAPFVK